MSKKNNVLLSWGITIFAGICGVVAFFMVFANAVTFTGFLFGENFTGLQVGLGYTVNKVQIFSASAGIILAHVFPLVGACLAIIGKGNKWIAVAASALMLTGGILALCTVSLLNGTYVGTPSLAAGSILSGIFAIIGSVAEGGTFFLKN